MSLSSDSTGAVFIAMFPPFAGVSSATWMFYFDEEMRMQGLDATTSSGWGGFIEVGAGECQCQCQNPIESVPVRYITYASIRCPLP